MLNSCVWLYAELQEKLDLVIFMGVLYPVRHPLLVLDLIHEHVAKDLMVFQSMQRGSRDLIDVEADCDFNEAAPFDEPAIPRCTSLSIATLTTRPIGGFLIVRAWRPCFVRQDSASKPTRKRKCIFAAGSQSKLRPMDRIVSTRPKGGAMSATGGYDAERLVPRGEELLSARRLSEALDLFRRAESCGPPADRCAAGRWMVYMLLGDFELAWRESEAIRRRGDPDPHRFWEGESLRGRRVILRCLHGFGDTVQFLRYVPRLREIRLT